ncbi:glutathione S-transferase [Pacificimonas flava]|uniref:Glutathione S-transferase n=2 Tax=Pacificimonas TaxID=1960290 RepID=A0A219B4N5_9SPHN|nr:MULTISPECIES: glutathione S-transferase family protein [Pacificimonas]MBZ6379484.1 glutathione S-transferase family protein [Pacificimonas aurantium]OWV33325.1 glutathione S-transferase [Pacificimonas flava]
MKLYHCQGARSFRPLWTLEELGIDYDLEVMPFPPRFKQEGYLDINPLGTVPTLVDEDTVLTESVAICHYLVETNIGTTLGMKPTEADYGTYLNFLYQSDATLTFPQTLFLRYKVFETERNLGQAGDDYVQWFFSRLRAVARMMGDREFVAGDRFTIADICFSYALKLAAQLELGEFPENVAAYWERMSARDGYKRAIAKETPEKKKKKKDG